jgi:Holliday junction resolvase RusA-like endonuclease
MEKEKPEMREYTVIIHGEPMSKQSVRVAPVYRKDGNVATYLRNGKLKCLIRHYQPSKFIAAEEIIRLSLQNQIKKDGFKILEHEVHIIKYEIIFRPLKSFTKKQMQMLENREIIYKTTNPDLPDNLKKFYNDCLKGLVWKDDGLICTENGVIKRYGIKPGIIITVKGY